MYWGIPDLDGPPPFAYERINPGTSESSTLLVPSTYTGASTPVVVWFHGYTESFASVCSDSSAEAVARALAAAGYFVWSPDAAGASTWGNAAASTAAVASWTSLLACKWNINAAKVGMVGVSMGGLVSLNTLLGGQIANVKGWYGCQAGSSLADIYGAGTYTGQIKTAFGIAGDGSDYASKTSGRDPQLVAAGSYPAIRYRWAASPSDTAIYKNVNADALSSKLSSRGVESGVVVASGQHGDPSNFPAADAVSFFGRCFA